MVTKVSHETMIVCIAECRRMTVPKLACTGALLDGALPTMGAL